MHITKDTAVTLSYKITDPATGKPLDAGHVAYLHGGYENIFPKVEAALDGQTTGFATTLELAEEDAFGARDESLVRTIPKSEFPPGVKVGGQLQGVGNDGQPQVFNVVKIKGPEVHLDGNHPLAGQALRFSCKVTQVREASAEEIAHRHCTVPTDTIIDGPLGPFASSPQGDTASAAVTGLGRAHAGGAVGQSFSSRTTSSSSTCVKSR